MAKIIQKLSAPTTRALLTSELPKTAYPQTFGELMFIYRTSICLSQRQVAQAAELSESYFSELENSKRVAPPYATALRIAAALNLSANEESNFVGIAASERAALLDDLHLPPQIRQLIALLRVAGPRLPTEVVNLIETKLQEVYV